MAHKFETESANSTVSTTHVPAKATYQPETTEKKDSTIVHAIPVVSTSPSPPPNVPVPVSHTQQQVAQTLERWNLAESVEEVDDAAWRETDEQENAWKEEHISEYAQESTNLETVAEETGSGLVAVALYDYQAAAEDELSFDPDEIITNIEMVKRIYSILFELCIYFELLD